MLNLSTITSVFPRLILPVLGLIFLLTNGCFSDSESLASEEALSKKFNIESGDAIISLRIAAEQADAEFLYSVQDVEGIQTNAVNGYYTLDDALAIMLSDTPLVFISDDSRGYSIRTKQK